MDFMLKDLIKQKESIEKVIDSNKAIIEANKERPNSNVEEEKVARLITWWTELEDLMEHKSRMLKNAVKTLEQENATFKEKIVSAYTLPAVSQKEELMEQAEFRRLFDQLPLEDLCQTVALKIQLTDLQESKLTAWVEACASSLYDKTKHLIFDHFLEQGRIM